jgi:protein-S-isoprenylcysteine O-methyltransferase Ste14
MVTLVGVTLLLSRVGLPSWSLAAITLGGYALTIIVLENLFVSSRIAFARARSGSQAKPTGFSRERRLLLKAIGLAGSIAALAAAYWLFPVYRDGGAKDLIGLARHLWLPFVLVAPLYIWYVDARSEDPEDSYFHAGLLLTGGWHLADRGLIVQHALQWLVKGFFLPLMLGFFFNQLAWLSQLPGDKALAAFISEPGMRNWLRVHEFLYSFLLMIDVGVACVGYLFTLKLFDSEARSTDASLFGWTVCLVCYAPFWELIGQRYLKYDAGTRWDFWLADWPTLMALWSITILLLECIYVWATVQFGIRFSNLTHRGIITNGPYRWLKHPAYTTKIASFWLTSMPFLSVSGVLEGARLSILLAGVSAIYYLRAKTEEAHLSIDPIYRQYTLYMRSNDLIARARQGLKWRRC